MAEHPAAKQHRADKPAEHPGQEWMAREEPAAAIGAVAAANRRRGRLHRAAKRCGAVVLEAARAAAAHAREAAAKTAAGARLGEARGQDKREAEQQSHDESPPHRS